MEQQDNKIYSWDYLTHHNPWDSMFNHDAHSLLISMACLDGATFIQKDDEPVILNHYNRRGGSESLQVDLFPEPYRGNLKNPRIVILSLNPGYVPRLNRDLFNMLDIQFKEDFLRHLRDNVLLKGDGRLVFNNVDNVIGDGYWYNKLGELMTDSKKEYGISDDDVLSRIALIQYVPYFSEKLTSWTVGEHLKTQLYARKHIRRLLHAPEKCIFLVMRAEKYWRTLIGEEMEDGRFKDRFIINKHYRVQSISKGNLGDDNYSRILNNLR